MHWHILGAGAIGQLWAGKLIKAGHKVTLILRNREKLALYRQQPGLSITNNDGTERFLPQATLAEECRTIENLLVTTKAFATLSAFNSVHSALSHSARVLLLHNGMGPQQQLVEAYPQLQIWAGSTTDGAYLTKPFELVQAGTGETRIGMLSDNQTDLSNSDFAAQLKMIDSDLIIENEILPVLWRKLAINCAINPLTAIYNCRNGELLKFTDRRAAMSQLCKEVEQVANALNIPLFDRPLMEQAYDVAEITGTNHSSMQQDIQLNRPCEIEMITGYLCEAAEQAGVTVPANQLALEAVRGLCNEQS